MKINSVLDLPEKYRVQTSQQLAQQTQQPIRIVGQDQGGAVIAETAPKAPVKKGSQLEEDFAYLLAVNEVPEPEREAVIVPGRRYRIDFFFRRPLLAIECDGGVWGGKSGHNSGTGIERDAEKSRFLSLHGIRLYRVTRKSLDEKPMEIIAQIKEILAPWYTI